MRAMWIATETATRLGLGNEFFDRKPTHVTPPGTRFLRNAERLYGLWFISMNAYTQGMAIKHNFRALGNADEDSFRTFQGRAALGALTTTSYWLVVILATLIEAYTKDVLAFVALRDPAITARPDDHAASRKRRSTTRNPALVPRRWARQWLGQRKDPAHWIRGFE